MLRKNLYGFVEFLLKKMKEDGVNVDNTGSLKRFPRFEEVQEVQVVVVGVDFGGDHHVEGVGGAFEDVEDSAFFFGAYFLFNGIGDYNHFTT